MVKKPMSNAIEDHGGCEVMLLLAPDQEEQLALYRIPVDQSHAYAWVARGRVEIAWERGGFEPYDFSSTPYATLSDALSAATPKLFQFELLDIRSPFATEIYGFIERKSNNQPDPLHWITVECNCTISWASAYRSYLNYYRKREVHYRSDHPNEDEPSETSKAAA
jgi:hypothetical protein